MTALPLVFLTVALGFTLLPFLSIFSSMQGIGHKPSVETMVASAISPVAFVLCFLNYRPIEGLLVAVAGIVLSVLVQNRQSKLFLVSLGALSMALYLQSGWQPS